MTAAHPDSSEHTLVMAGLDPAIHPFAKTLTKMMDPRVISASTRVFDALLPAGDNGAPTLVMAGLDPAIHLFAKTFTKKMDPRVKPAGDGGAVVNRPAGQARG